MKPPVIGAGTIFLERFHPHQTAFRKSQKPEFSPVFFSLATGLRLGVT